MRIERIDADEGAGAVVGQVVAVDRGDDGVAQAHLLDLIGDRAAGSSGSFQVGLPVLTLQKPQRRVQVSPRIMKVAVPRSQHSPMFGQLASSQTVCSLSPSPNTSRTASVPAISARRRATASPSRASIHCPSMRSVSLKDQARARISECGL